MKEREKPNLDAYNIRRMKLDAKHENKEYRTLQRSENERHL